MKEEEVSGDKCSIKQKQLGAGILSYGTVLVLRNGISLLTLPVYLHWFSQEEFAALDIINVVVAFFTLLFFQLNVGYARYYYEARTTSKQQQYMSTLFWSYLLVSLIVVLPGMPIGYHWASAAFPQVDGVGIAALFAIASFLPMSLFEFFLINTRLLQDIKRYALLALSETVLRAGFTITFIAVGAGIAGFFLAVFLAFFIMMSVAIWYSRWEISRGCSAELLRNIRFTAPTIPGLVASYVNQYATRLIALGFLPLSQIALYSLAMKIAIIAKIMIQSFRLGWMPIAMEQMQETHNREKFFGNIFIKYVAGSVLLVAVAGCVTPFLLAIIAPENYRMAAALVPLLIAAFLISGAISILEIGCQIAEKTFWYSIAAVIGAIAGLTSLLLLIESMGVSAVAWSFLLSTIVTTSVMAFGSHRSHYLGYKVVPLIGLLAGIPLTAIAIRVFIK